MTSKEAIQRARKLSVKGEWYITESYQPFDDGLLHFCLVCVDGSFGMSSAGCLEECFELVETRLRQERDKAVA